MSRNFKLVVGAVFMLIVAAVMGQTQGDLALAARRPATGNGTSATGVPTVGSSGTGSNGAGATGTTSGGNVSGTSVTGIPATGVPATGVSGGPGATAIGQPGNGQNVTSVATSIVVVPPTLTPRPPQPSPTRSIKITIGTSTSGAPGATGVPG
jgi:hypothetical protein